MYVKLIYCQLQARIQKMPVGDDPSGGIKQAGVRGPP
jgi:hypothetical protein